MFSKAEQSHSKEEGNIESSLKLYYFNYILIIMSIFGSIINIIITYFALYFSFNVSDANLFADFLIQNKMFVVLFIWLFIDDVLFIITNLYLRRQQHKDDLESKIYLLLTIPLIIYLIAFIPILTNDFMSVLRSIEIMEDYRRGYWFMYFLYLNSLY